eukprot:7013372-Alexandrium_andersonii.AAC.1
MSGRRRSHCRCRGPTVSMSCLPWPSRTICVGPEGEVEARAVACSSVQACVRPRSAIHATV